MVLAIRVLSDSWYTAPTTYPQLYGSCRFFVPFHHVSRHIVPMYLRICLLYDVSEGRDVSYFDDNIAIVEVSTSWHSPLNATRC